MSTLRTITDFKSKLIGGGARPNLFEVELPAFPAAATASGATWGTASGAEAPSGLCVPAQISTYQPLEKNLKVADRTFDTWTVTIRTLDKLENNTGAITLLLTWQLPLSPVGVQVRKTFHTKQTPLEELEFPEIL